MTNLYTDTDSAKQVLNSVYGAEVRRIYREYISVIVDDKPTIIFKRNIVAVTKNGAFTEITCVGDIIFYVKEDYVTVVKKIMG